MKIVDLNILLYAANSASAHHAKARAWWEDALSGDEPVGLPWMVLLGFLRISTRRDIFPNALTAEAACDRIRAWLTQPNVRIASEGEEHWRLLETLIEETGTAGNLTSDAHLAAIAIHYGAALVSCDSDFSRFKGLRWENPLAGA